MKKSAVLKLCLEYVDGDTVFYYGTPVKNSLTNTRNSMTLISHDNKKYAFILTNNMLGIAISWDNITCEPIEFYSRIQNHFFGINHETGKCVYGILLHPIHKHVVETEFTLYESDVKFESLKLLESSEILPPEFSTAENWITAYYNANEIAIKA